MSLGSAKAEGKTITKRCVEGLESKNLLEGRTGVYKLEIWKNSLSARAIPQSPGPGRGFKHLGVQAMWVQQLSKQDILIVHQVATDVLMEHVPAVIRDRMIERWDTGFQMKKN